MSGGRVHRLAAISIHASCLALMLLVVLAAAQPVLSEDTWWHLAMGRAYATAGPHLTEDPLLHTAGGPPAPAAWLADVGLHAVERSLGFTGLRVLHASLVAGILALAWFGLRRVGGSRELASLGTAVVAAFAAYRLFQLRPHLVTILGVFLVIRLLFGRDAPTSLGRIAATGALFAVWANLHGGFVLGLALVGVGTAAQWGAFLFTRDDGARERARRLTLALAIGFVASLLNPTGAEPHLLYFAAGGASPELARVADEWTPLALGSIPALRLPPTPATWVGAWLLVLLTPLAALQQLRGGSTADGAARDPVLAALAVAALVAMLAAVRLVWLSLLPLLLLALAVRQRGWRPAQVPSARWLASGAAVALLAGFVVAGDWPMVSRLIRHETFARPYVSKIDLHAVWFLRDSGASGRLFNDYRSGNLLGYWLAPELRVFVNGSLNFPPETLDDLYTIEAVADDPTELLDRYAVDLFHGSGVPVAANPVRPPPINTTRVEANDAWLPVFRNLRSAIYLRDVARNRTQLERIARYYADRGVPFTPGNGFDVEQVLREAPEWAARHGVVPVDFARLQGSGMALPGSGAANRLAALYCALGLYERAEALDRRARSARPHHVPTARRLVWSLLHQRRYRAAAGAARILADVAAPGDALSGAIARAARLLADRPDAERSALVSLLPLFTRAEASELAAGFLPAELRTR